jgi:hypothetical protein
MLPVRLYSLICHVMSKGSAENSCSCYWMGPRGSLRLVIACAPKCAAACKCHVKACTRRLSSTVTAACLALCVANQQVPLTWHFTKRHLVCYFTLAGVA